MKQGGVNWNGSPCSKGGVRGTHRCKYCGRSYKMDWAKERHEKQCYEYRKARGLI